MRAVAKEPLSRHIEIDRVALRRDAQRAIAASRIHKQTLQYSAADLEGQRRHNKRTTLVKLNPPCASNVIVTAKYNVWSFLPRVLLEQLKRPSNIYFLFMAVLQSIRAVSNTNGYPTILIPLTIVFLCTALKEGLEDRERHRADRVTNSKRILALNANGIWEPKLWGDVRVGDIIRVLENETIPADLFLLSVETDEDQNRLQREPTNNTSGSAGTSGMLQGFTDKSEGVCYVETKSLDGETNLKVRSAIALLNNLVHSQRGLDELQGSIDCEQPNPRINSFEGNISIHFKQGTAEALGVHPNAGEEITANYQVIPCEDKARLTAQFAMTPKQMLLRSCILRNTLAVTGIVVFTGHETKVFCSNTDPVVKTSSIDKKLNSLIIRIVMIQQLVCFLGAMMGALWMVHFGESRWYLGVTSDVFSVGEFVKLHLRYFIIMQNFVPISLNVSVEFVKYWQAYFMEQDLEMYDEQSDTPMIVRSSALNEDLGRVHHVFTDKTGTLTMNLMQFRYCMIGETHYGGTIHEDDAHKHSPHGSSRSRPSQPPIIIGRVYPCKFVAFDDTNLAKQLNEPGAQSLLIRRFLRHLALCHTVIPTRSFAETCNAEVPEYSASSPDEQALVSAAAFCNVRFVHRSPSQMLLMESQSDRFLTYQVLDLLEFDSDRKRMSLILETPDGDIELLCKGADNVILERLSPTAQTAAMVQRVHHQLSEYAKIGLRTLCIASRRISRDQYLAWHERYLAAHTSMHELVKKRKGLPNAIDPLVNEIESELELLGVTAVQDRLQPGVPRTLQMLQNSNIKVWTLTGDKMETAVNIGYACSLLSSRMEVKLLHAEDYTTAFQEMTRLLESFGGTTTDHHQTTGRLRLSRGKGWKMVLRRVLDGFHAVVYRTSAPRNRRKKKKPGRKSSSLRSSGYQTGALLDWGSTANDYKATYSEDEDMDSSDSNHEESKRLLVSPSSSPRLLALVIDGSTLDTVLGFSSQLHTLFYQLTRVCSCVICCRVSPKQKAQIVRFVCEKEPKSITLAIGDGANDVGMIQMAHIGVGISGVEGAQAVNASDYAIAQFRFLQKLLFVHGRWAYRRVTKLMSYMLYKNVTYVLTTFWFGAYSGFSGQPLVIDIAAQSFNVLYTSIPVILFAVFDQDVDSRSLHEFPHLYSHYGQKNVLLRAGVFWKWMLNGLWHSILLFFVTVALFEHQGDGDGQALDGVYCLGFVIFTNLVVVVNWKLLLENHRVTLVFVLTMLCSVAMWLLVSNLVSNSSMVQAVGVMYILERAPIFWFGVVLVCVVTMLRDLVWKIIVRYVFPSEYHILQEREKLRLDAGRPRNKGQHGKCIPLIGSREVLNSPLTQCLIEHPVEAEIPALLRRDGLRGRNSGHWQTMEELAFNHGTSHSAALKEKIDLMPVAESTKSATLLQSDQYHGYAFSQDEHCDSEVEAASCSKLQQQHPAKHLPEVDRLGSLRTKQFVEPVRKMIKSVQGQKNA